MAIKRILVADDEESIRWVLSKALSKQGYQVDLATNGQEALEMLPPTPRLAKLTMTEMTQSMLVSLLDQKATEEWDLPMDSQTEFPRMA